MNKVDVFMQELHSATAAEPLDGMKVLVTFENNFRGIFACEYLTRDSCWAKLKSPAFFHRAKAECGTLCWAEDVDVAPESVWADAQKNPHDANTANMGRLQFTDRPSQHSGQTLPRVQS